MYVRKFWNWNKKNKKKYEWTNKTAGACENQVFVIWSQAYLK